MKRFAVTAAFMAAVFALSGCNETSPSDTGDVVGNQVDVPEFEIDIDGHTKTKTVQVPAPVAPKTAPRVQPPAPVKPAPVAPPAVRPPAPAPKVGK